MTDLTYINSPTITIDGVQYDRQQFITDVQKACIEFQPIIQEAIENKIIHDAQEDARSMSLTMHAIKVSLIMCAAREEIVRAVLEREDEPPTREDFAELAGDLFDDVLSSK